MKGLDGNSVAHLEKHKRSQKYFKLFCEEKYGVSDMAFNKITRTVIDEFATYIMVDCNCAHNTTLKYMQIIKKIYRIGIDNGWVKVNAFSNYKFRMKTVVRECLTEEELKTIVEKEFTTQRLDYVRDIFVFSCYTGLAYIDIKNLKRSNIGEFKNRAWIKSRRTKTNVEASLPLLPTARRILDKRNPDWFDLMPNALLFDVISNQKLNGYLKEISDICKIKKLLTFHIAHHTFATTVTLLNGVPIESISKMLGHSRIIMTQHYSKVADLKIERDSEMLFRNR
jgi:site-specific recombinase XerD